MMSSYTGDVGTQIELHVHDANGPLAIPSNATKKIFIRKPNKHVVEKAATFVTNGSDGKVYYRTVTGDFDIAGEYKAQAFVSWSDGSWSSTVLTWTVEEKLRNKI